MNEVGGACRIYKHRLCLYITSTGKITKAGQNKLFLSHCASHRLFDVPKTLHQNVNSRNFDVEIESDYL